MRSLNPVLLSQLIETGEFKKKNDSFLLSLVDQKVSSAPDPFSLMLIFFFLISC